MLMQVSNSAYKPVTISCYTCAIELHHRHSKKDISNTKVIYHVEEMVFWLPEAVAPCTLAMWVFCGNDHQWQLATVLIDHRLPASRWDWPQSFSLCFSCHFRRCYRCCCCNARQNFPVKSSRLPTTLVQSSRPLWSSEFKKNRSKYNTSSRCVIVSSYGLANCEIYTNEVWKKAEAQG